MQKVMKNIWKVIRTVLLAITSPVWFPWKLLFGRKGGENEANDPLKVIGHALLNVAKLAVFMIVIFMELLVIHKIRYSPLTYPMTRNSVREYYLMDNTLELEGFDEAEKDGFEKMLDYIDGWDLDEKNKMTVILDSTLVKDAIKYTDNDTVYYIVDKFNRDGAFRERFRRAIKNIDATVTRFIKEIPENDFARLNDFLNPIISVSSWALDYASALDIGGAVFDWAVGEYDIRAKGLSASVIDIEKAIKTALDYSEGASLNTVSNYWQ